jgi:hypothetical protein
LYFTFFFNLSLFLGQKSSPLKPEDVAISGSLEISHDEHNLLERHLFNPLVEQGLQLQYAEDGIASPPPYPGKVLLIGKIVNRVTTPTLLDEENNAIFKKITT